MKSLSCRESGCDCDYIATGQTEEELMGKLRERGMKEHGKTEEDMIQMKDKLKGFMRSVWGRYKDAQTTTKNHSGKGVTKMSNITGARKPLEINEIRLIAMDALTAFLRSRHTYSMNTHELPDMIIKAGFARGKLPRNASDVDGLTERRILDVIGRLLNEGIITWGGSIGAGLFSTDNISITEHGEKILLEEDTPG
jgi:predicted small metal-binding protein